MAPEKQEPEDDFPGQFWFVLGLVVAFVGMCPLLTHTLPHWPSLIFFAATGGLFYMGNRVRKKD